MFLIYLALIGSGGNVLFLGLVLLLIGHVRAGLVLLEVTKEFRVGTDQASNIAHDVLGERPDLVGTNDGGVGHCLTRTRDMDEEVSGGHSFCSESEGKSHSERETFGSDHDNQCYGNDQDVCEGNEKRLPGGFPGAQLYGEANALSVRYFAGAVGAGTEGEPSRQERVWPPQAVGRFLVDLPLNSSSHCLPSARSYIRWTRRGS